MLNIVVKVARPEKVPSFQNACSLERREALIKYKMIKMYFWIKIIIKIKMR